MAVTPMRQEYGARSQDLCVSDEPCTIWELNRADDLEALDFLAARPIHTVYMASLIRDNGLVSPHNRGSFYAVRDSQGRLVGVALLGHATLIETRTDSSVAVFARLARNCQNAFLIRGERDTINNFWKHYARPGQEPRLICIEQLLELRRPLSGYEAVDLRPATVTDLNKVLSMNASMVYDEGGINPLHLDPSGFRQRTARRIDQGRIWLWIQESRLIFKAEVVGETPQVTYLEGVHVHAEERRKGLGLRCLNQLSSILLTRSQSICLTVNERNHKAAALYEKAGYQSHSDYETIHLR
jgi:uncharacterized protein